MVTTAGWICLSGRFSPAVRLTTPFIPLPYVSEVISVQSSSTVSEPENYVFLLDVPAHLDGGCPKVR